jgi:hypothetical protein
MLPVVFIASVKLPAEHAGYCTFDSVGKLPTGDCATSSNVQKFTSYIHNTTLAPSDEANVRDIQD